MIENLEVRQLIGMSVALSGYGIIVLIIILEARRRRKEVSVIIERVKARKRTLKIINVDGNDENNRSCESEKINAVYENDENNRS